MKGMSTGIVELNSTGICKIDTDKICRSFRETSMISQFGDQFMLLDYTTVRFLRRVKITISQQDAETIIAQLGLLKFKDPIFVRATEYRLTDKLWVKSYKKKA